MLTDLIELGRKMKKQMKDTQDEIKQNIQGTNHDRMETRTQSNDLEQKEKINIQPEQNEETRIQKSEDSLTLGQPECSNIWIIGVPEGEEQQQEIENLFEQIMMENFPSLAKEIDFRKSRKPRESQRSWKQWGTHQGTSSLTYLSSLRWKIRRES